MRNRPNAALRAKTVGSLVLLLTIVLGPALGVKLLGGISRAQAVIEHAGLWAPAAYIAIKTAIFIAAPLSSLPLQIAAGAIFDIPQATVYTLLGALIGGSINYWLARSLGRNVVIGIVGRDGMTRVEDLTVRIGGWRTLLVARVFLSPMYDFISYAAGFLGVPYPHYVAVSLFGGIIPSALWAAFGAGLAGDRRHLLIASYALAALYLAALVVYRRFEEMRNEGPKPDK